MGQRTPVLIVGAGPTGLILALWLKKRGIDFRIVDKSSKPGTTSRALAVQARTLEFYSQMGLAQQLIDAGITIKQLIMRRFGKVVATAELGAMGQNLSPFPYLLFCSQDVHESLLCEELRKLGVEVERNTELVEFTQDHTKVTATLKSLSGTETLTADYMCGCDGARSQVRHRLKEDFPGGTYSQVFFVADVQAEGDAAEGLQISLSKKDFCIIMPIQQQNSVRLTGLVPPENEAKENITFDDVKESIAKNTGLKLGKVNWFSTYRVHHRVAEAFRVDRVFLAGDAGHIHSPAGGQGMNTGIGDAINLAWKLSDVIQGHFTEKVLLDSYAQERMAFAKVLIRSTDTAFKFVASRSLLGSVFRAYILPKLFAFLTKWPVFVRLAFKAVSQTRIQYRKSALSQGSEDLSSLVQAGDRLPWVCNSNGDNYKTLNDMNWQVHVYGKATSTFKSGFKDYPIYELDWNAEAERKGLVQNAIYLLRPDGHIAFTAKNQNAQSVKNYLQTIGHKK